VVQGSVLQPDTPGAPLLFTAPSVPTARRALALWASTDAGRTFLPLLGLTDRPSAYSDLVQLGRHDIGVLYETGITGPYEALAFRRVPLL
jgi:sialidase-1